MAESKLKSREWTFEFQFEDGEVPDIRKQYTTKTVYRPYAMEVTVRAAGDGEPVFGHASIHGHRVNKDGLGTLVNDSFYPYNVERLPQVIADLIIGAIYQASQDAGTLDVWS